MDSINYTEITKPRRLPSFTEGQISRSEGETREQWLERENAAQHAEIERLKKEVDDERAIAEHNLRDCHEAESKVERLHGKLNDAMDAIESTLEAAYEVVQQLEQHLTIAEIRIRELETTPPAARSNLLLPCGHNGYWKTIYGNCMACRAERAEARVQTLEERLEITYAFDQNMNRIEVPPEKRATFPDGISCRDATIALQTKHIEKLEARVKELEGNNNASTDDSTN